MNYKLLDKKWNDIWEKSGINKFDRANLDNKYYVLEMFSYPSGANLHLGHWYNYGPSDTFARFKKMQGYNVFHPMGFDAFGLPAENYAIKTGIHPKDSTFKNIATMERQLREIGAMYDWDSEIYTCSPEYYKWTQWIFLQLYKSGLAYQKLSPVNWCSSCNTVIANEQVIDGECERCGTTVVRKEMTQWFFKITDYAEELLTSLDNLDWPEKTKTMQRNWLGRSQGGEIDFQLVGCDEKIKVFTTRADTLMGVTYVVLAPEHRLVDVITTSEHKETVAAYKDSASKSSDIERQSTSKEKTGVFTGAYCLHPVTNERLPVYIADYCLVTYGTGAVMAVPAHDERDFDFAKKFGLDIKRVITATDGDAPLPYCEYGILTNSGEFDKLDSQTAINSILKRLEETSSGKAKVNYRLRDWSVSRQRYWGAPIPVIYCDSCGVVPVPEKDLPVELPYNVNFTPDGSSPLKKCAEFIETTCPACGKKARRDPDTLDTFVCSSWYQMRYADSKNDARAFDKDIIDKMLPVDKYVGGPEHACMHLLYSRFITKALRDAGFLSFDEPFKSLVHQGIILGPDGNRMSKSKGNIINPDKYVTEFGSDVFRMYLMFGFSYIEGGAWNDDGIKAIVKFLDRIERIVTKTADYDSGNIQTLTSDEKELEYALHYAIKSITADLEIFSFNTAIARLMELVNAIYKYDSLPNKKTSFLKGILQTLITLLAPFAPHISEELNTVLNGSSAPSLLTLRYPVFDSGKLVKDEIEIAVQINSKVKSKIMIPTSATDEEIKNIALNDEKLKEFLDGAQIKKVIVIKSRLVNIVV